jgi:hypothetical protein
MKCCKFLTVLLLIVVCCVDCLAQDSEYVYRDPADVAKDSAIKALQAAETKAKMVSASNNDTALYNQQLAIAGDSAEALKESPSFRYAKNLDSLLIALQKKQNTEQPKTDVSWLGRILFSPVVKLFFWTLAGLFIVFILYKLFLTEGFFQRRSYAAKINVVTEKPQENYASTDYNRLIDEAVAAKDFRMAVRYHYLQTLQKLAAKNVISFDAAKTNYQYVLEVSVKPYKQAFAALTLQYEYAWYGGFDLESTAFGKIQQNFKQFNSQL